MRDCMIVMCCSAERSAVGANVAAADPVEMVRRPDRIGAVREGDSRRVGLEAAGDARTTAHPPTCRVNTGLLPDHRAPTAALRFARPVLTRLADAGINDLADVTPLLHHHLTACHLIGMSVHGAAGRAGDHRVPDRRRGGGDRTTLCLDGVPIALVLGLVNLVAAEALNRAPGLGPAGERR